MAGGRKAARSHSEVSLDGVVIPSGGVPAGVEESRLGPLDSLVVASPP